MDNLLVMDMLIPLASSSTIPYAVSINGGFLVDGVDKLENSLNELFVKKAPFQIPKATKDTIVAYLPWINVFLGVVSLWAAYSLWHWANVYNGYAEVANNLSRIYGGTTVVDNRLSAVVWLAVAILVIEGLLYLIAFAPTKARSKKGWNLLFYAFLVNALYGLVILFSDYGGISRFISSLFGTVVGLYFLFQIRNVFTVGSVSTKTESHTDSPKK